MYPCVTLVVQPTEFHEVFCFSFKNVFIRLKFIAGKKNVLLVYLYIYILFNSSLSVFSVSLCLFVCVCVRFCSLTLFVKCSLCKISNRKISIVKMAANYKEGNISKEESRKKCRNKFSKRKPTNENKELKTRGFDAFRKKKRKKFNKKCFVFILLDFFYLFIHLSL